MMPTPNSENKGIPYYAFLIFTAPIILAMLIVFFSMYIIVWVCQFIITVFASYGICIVGAIDFQILLANKIDKGIREWMK